MIFYLDGNDWEADYFISNSDYWAWQNNCCRLQNMYLDSAVIAGFTSEDEPSVAAYSATVPGCDRSVLLENGVIDDPYFGRNLVGHL